MHLFLFVTAGTWVAHDGSPADKREYTNNFNAVTVKVAHPTVKVTTTLTFTPRLLVDIITLTLMLNSKLCPDLVHTNANRKVVCKHIANPAPAYKRLSR